MNGIIYGLADQGVIRYVGQTKHPRRRYKAHINRCKDFEYHSCRWIRTVLAQGREPEMVVLEDNVASEDLDAREAFWITQFDNLTNHHGGGHHVVSDETRAKLSAAAKRQWAEGRGHGGGHHNRWSWVDGRVVSV